MTKQQLVALVAKKESMTFNEVERIITTTLDTISEELEHHREVTIRGFGTFKTVPRAKKIARNISKGTQVVIPAHNSPVLKFSNELKDRVKG